MALEALARYARQASGIRATVNLKVKAKAGTQEKTFQPITGNNMFTIQQWEVTSTVITITGNFNASDTKNNVNNGTV